MEMLPSKKTILKDGAAAEAEDGAAYCQRKRLLLPVKDGAAAVGEDRVERFLKKKE